jgi:crotonobetainyl-CoA:carnitine CoA-transferase CaiB-like acyl-CoA transferase
MAAYLASVALHEKRTSGRGQVIDLAIYETLLTLLGPQVVNYDQLGLVQERAGSRLPFTAPRNTYRTRDDYYVSIAGSAQSTFERICAALHVPDLVKDPRFATSRERLTHAAALDVELQAAIERFDRDDLLERFVAIDATVAPVNSVADVIADPHVQARENIITLDDEELGGPVRIQNVVGKLSRTPGEITRAGPRLGEHNRAVLIDELGYSEAELAAAGIALDDMLARQPEAAA